MGVALSKPFDFSKELGIFRSAGNWGRAGWKPDRHIKADRVRRQIEEEYDAEIAEAVAAAIASGRSYDAILERARKRKVETEERDRLLREPPPLHGSAAWVDADDLRRFLKGREAFDHPSSILLGTFVQEGARHPAGFVHWDGRGHTRRSRRRAPRLTLGPDQDFLSAAASRQVGTAPQASFFALAPVARLPRGRLSDDEPTVRLLGTRASL